MASTTSTNFHIDPCSGFCSETETFHSLRPSDTIPPIPPPSQPISVAQFALSLLHSTTTPLSEKSCLISATTGHHITYSHFLHQTKSLAFSLQKHYSLSKGDVAFIISPQSLHIPIIYFSLLSLGVIMSPTDPDNSISEITHEIQLSRPSVAFATSHTSYKLPSNLRRILIDSPEFVSLLTRDTDCSGNASCIIDNGEVVVNQSDVAAIMYSSGTTGRVKGVPLTHRNLIATIACSYNQKIRTATQQTVSLTTRVFFHLFGFAMMMRAISHGEALVILETFELEAILEAIEKFKATYAPISPNYIVALLKSETTNKYNLTSLRHFVCAGASLGMEVAHKFKEKFPNIAIVTGYGMTETASAGAFMREPKERERVGSVGRLANFMEAKIVDVVTGEALPPGGKGELWLRGPCIMRGYLRDETATAQVLDSHGWLKTGDLCYFDSHGFLYVVDRLKELIKYNGFQVAPAELEHLLQANSNIADAAVVGYPDEEAGQIPIAFVVKNPGTAITGAQIMDFIADQVAPHRRIRRVTFIDSIPRSVQGKILRKELIARALSGN